MLSRYGLRLAVLYSDRFDAFHVDGVAARHSADTDEEDAADDPFGINDMRQNADGRYEHPATRTTTEARIV